MNSNFLAQCIIAGKLRFLTNTATRSLDSFTRKAYLSARRRHDQRTTSSAIAAWPKRQRILVHLSETDALHALALAKAAHPRRQNWDASKAGYKTSVNNVNNGRYSSRCDYTRWSYVPVLESYVILSRWGGGGVLYHFHDDTHFVPAPRGWYWDVDDNGLRLASRACSRDDFHPNSDDLRRGTRHLLQQAAALRRQRRQLAAQARREKQLLLRHSAGVLVGLADSLDAGNCQVGSLQFAQRHGLDPKGYYFPADLLSLEPDNPRIKLAIAAAARRHARFTAVGAEVFYPKPMKIKR